MPAEQRDSFSNLLLLCLGHHEEVDGDERRYPAAMLKKWKIDHEGGDKSVLDRLTVLDTDALLKLLTEIATPPLERLEAVTKRLEETGTATAETVAELKRIIAAMSTSEGGIDARTARVLALSAEVFGAASFERSARALGLAADVLPGVVSRMESAAGRMSQFY
ncbi:hypothetical protein [Micromonospora sp. NPDC004704]